MDNFANGFFNLAVSAFSRSLESASSVKAEVRLAARLEIGVPFRRDADEAVAEYSSDPEGAHAGNGAAQGRSH